VKIKIQTEVGASLEDVKQGFTSSLFLKLNPPFPPVKLKEFGGCVTGDKVALELNFLLFKQNWISDIVDDGENNHKWFFVDKGVVLPFFLSSWKHRHIVQQHEEGSMIVDDINYTTGTILSDLIFYPLLYLQFLYRKPIYRRIFKA
jgi:ligand-binding SRPBCC domain-containing protein